MASENTSLEGNGKARSVPRSVSMDGVNLIKQFERLTLTPYRDSGGRWTIGYGHLILPTEHFRAITPQEAERLFQKDLFVVVQAVNSSVHVPLSQHEFDALASFAFNVGIQAFRTSTLLKKLNAGNYIGAANQFLLWDKVLVKGRLVAESGLLRRRQAERALYLQR